MGEVFVSGLHHSMSSVFLSVFPQATQGPDAVSVPGHCEQQEVGVICVRALMVSFPDHSFQYESRNYTAREGDSLGKWVPLPMLTGIMHVCFLVAHLTFREPYAVDLQGVWVGWWDGSQITFNNSANH